MGRQEHKKRLLAEQAAAEERAKQKPALPLQPTQATVEPAPLEPSQPVPLEPSQAPVEPAPLAGKPPSELLQVVATPVRSQAAVPDPQQDSPGQDACRHG